MVLYSRIKFYFFLSKPGFHHLFDQSACLKMDADVHTPRGMWTNASSVTLSSYHMLTPHHLLGLPGLGLPTGGGETFTVSGLKKGDKIEGAQRFSACVVLRCFLKPPSQRYITAHLFNFIIIFWNQYFSPKLIIPLVFRVVVSLCVGGKGGGVGGCLWVGVHVWWGMTKGVKLNY